MNQPTDEPSTYERYHSHSTVRTNTKSIVSVVLGICSLLVPYLGSVLGIVAIICAILSFKEIRRGEEKGRTLSVAGLVCGIVGTVFYAIQILLFILAVGHV
ncbi:DUF4190 domain-containing protein [Paenibacillus zeisoli]|uniref:DUF4190 domain-containing protein n=1 Tax=Paenibacillus zeisoli TaxID=2496267 RepID=A0A3S1BBZ5_9BACL|nr:DUF4190 domain-containing protein [Paenibacillus zeisoli]RUT35990.1 DUF4190 domain-containing protein [Paenibacillus zeisoli]